MLSDTPKTENLQQILDDFQSWVRVKYLTKRISVERDAITIYGPESRNYWLNLILGFTLCAIPLVFLLRLVLSVQVGMHAKILLVPVAAFFLILFSNATRNINPDTALRFNFKEQTATNTTTTGLFKRKTVETEIKLKDITHVQLWRDGNMGIYWYCIDVWVNKTKTNLVTFNRTPTYTGDERYIAEWAKRILETAIQEYTALSIPAAGQSSGSV